MKSKLLVFVILLLTSIGLCAAPYSGRYQGLIAQEKVELTLSQFDDKVFGELLGQLRLRLLLKGEVDSNNLLLANLINPLTGQSVAVRISQLSDDKLTFAEIKVNSITKEAAPDQDYVLERVVGKNEGGEGNGARLERDAALVGNWVSRSIDGQVGTAARREKVEIRGDGEMYITEGVVNSSGISTELPGARVLRLAWRTEGDTLFISPDGSKTWLEYGKYKVEINRLVLLRAENNSKQTFVRE